MQDFSDDDIVNPEVYADEARLHAMFAELRRSAPVRWVEPESYRPFWAIACHNDIMAIERASDQFIAGARNRLQTIDEERRVAARTGGAPIARSLPTMDSPDHRKYRAITQSWFLPANLRKLDESIASLCKEYVDLIEDEGASFDFVGKVGLWIPLRAIMLILGVPPADGMKMHELTSRVFSPHDADVVKANQDSAEKHPVGAAQDEFFAYFRELLAARRLDPRDDLATVIANARVDDAPIQEHIALSYCVSIIAAGHETTAAAMSGGVHALATHRDQFATLRADPELIKTGQEEILRFVSPVRSFMRTAVSQCEVRDQIISAGDAVLLLYPSANRDKEVFENPETFDVARAVNPHVAFGYGPHLCLGLQLARLEMKHFLGEFTRRVKSLELAGETQWRRANFLGGVKSMPLHCSF